MSKKKSHLKVSEMMEGRVSSALVVAELWHCGMEFRKWALLGMGVSLASKVASTACALAVAAAVDSKTGGVGMGAWALAGWSLGGIAAVFAASKAIEALLAPVMMLISQRAEGYAESKLIDKSFAAMLALPRSSWAGVEMSEAAARLDVKQPLRHFIFCAWRAVVPSAMEVVVATAMLWSMGMGAGSMAVAASAAAYVALSMTLGPKVNALAKKATQTRGQKDSTVVRLLSSLELARAYGARSMYAKAREGGARRAGRSLLDVTLASAASDAVSWVALVGGSTLAFWLGARALESGAATPGAFAALMSVSGVALVGMKNLSFAFMGMVGSGAELAFALLAIREARALGRGSAFAPQVEPALPASLAVEGLTVAYPGAGKTALDEFSLRMGPGEKVYLVGASGSGKTTLMRALCGFVEIKSGTMEYGGADMAGEVPPAAIALMPQEADVLGGSVRMNLSLGKARADEGQMWTALEAAGLSERVKMGGGLDAQVGAGGAALSGGERARLALARAWVSGRPLLLLDEPTSALDAKTEIEVIGEIEVRQDVSAIISIHRVWAIPSGARVVAMKEGRVVQDGTREKLASSEGLFADLLRVLEPEGESSPSKK